MKASPRQQMLLLELQEHDHAIARIKRKAAQLPERAQVAALQSEVTAARDEFMRLQGELDTQKAEISRVENDVETVRQRLERDNQLLLTSTSPKAAQALQDEIDTLTRRLNELEERELALMEENESTQQSFDAASAVMSGVDARRSELNEALAAAEQALATELSRVKVERSGLAAEVQRDLLEHYEQLRERIGIGVARLNGKVSEASNMELAPAELSDILALAEDEVVHCPQSGAILVRTTL